MSQQIVAVTGATGFLGRRLVPALKAQGWQVRALRRRIASVALDDTEWVSGDLGDEASLARLVAGSDLVIHCAGAIKARRRDDFFAANAGGTQRLARAAAKQRLILVSSLVAREPQLSDYAASKRASEETARAEHPDRLTILRPPAIYGPGDRETLALFSAIRRLPVMPLPGPPSARLALAHVDDVIAAILHAAGRDLGPGPFAISGAQPSGYSWREIFTAAAAAVGTRPRLVLVPGWVVSLAGSLAEVVAVFKSDPAIFGSGKVREIRHPDWSVGHGEMIPGVPAAQVSLSEGFVQTVAWYRQHGWLAPARFTGDVVDEVE